MSNELTDEHLYTIAKQHEGEYGTDMLGFARDAIAADRAARQPAPPAVPVGVVEALPGWTFEDRGPVIEVTAPDGARWCVVESDDDRENKMGAFFYSLCRAALAALREEPQQPQQPSQEDPAAALGRAPADQAQQRSLPVDENALQTDAYAEGRKDQFEEDKELLAWAYGKLAYRSFSELDDCLKMDRIKLIFMGAL